MRLRLPRLSRLLDSIPEVLCVYAATYAVCVTAVSVAEDWSAVDGLWYGLVTVTTTGYGDLSPHTGWGRVFAAIMMMVSWVLNILLGAQVAAKLIVNSDAWTDLEQEEVKHLLREIHARGER